MQVTRCDTDETLGAASMVRSGRLTVFTARSDSSAEEAPIGPATAHGVPASLAMGQFGQLRDLHVLPAYRGRGAAAALVGAVRGAALAAGARRLSLVTEVDNQDALRLYRRLGFESVQGLASLSLDLARLGPEE